MALIKCPECGKEISDTSKNCIHCGYALKEENIASPQTIVNVEAPKKEKSSKKFLIIGITLFLCALILSASGMMTCASQGIFGTITPITDESVQILNISKVAAIISFIYSLVLLAVPKLRKVLFIIPYFIANLVSAFFIYNYVAWAFDGCGVVTFVPSLIALFVSYVLIFISMFIKDEKH